MEEKQRCFCCNKVIEPDEKICTRCGAIFTTLDVSQPKNPNTKKYIARDGSQYVSNGWKKVGAWIALLSLVCIFMSVVAESVGAIIWAIVLFSISCLMMIIGYVKIYHGKMEVRKKNDVIRETNPDYHTEEDEKGLFERIGDKIKEKTNNRNISCDKQSGTLEVRLKELKECYEKELISKEEYDKAKAVVLQIRSE